MKRLATTMLVSMLVACINVACSNSQEQSSPAGGAAAPAFAADSIVLERTLCFGTCPAYRLRVGSDGGVHFQSRNPGDQERVATDTVDAAGFEWLLGEAQRIGFHDLPERIGEDRDLCPQTATDHPSHITTIFGERTNRVDHYTGCYALGAELRQVEALVRLRRFESAIDSVAGAARWIRPARLGG